MLCAGWVQAGPPLAQLLASPDKHQSCHFDPHNSKDISRTSTPICFEHRQHTPRIREAEAQAENELNRATDPRLRDQIGAGGHDEDELRRAEDAARRGAREGVDLYRFVRRAAEASQGEVSASTDADFLHEDHPLVQTAVRWVRTTRFRKNDDHRLAYVVVPDLEKPELVATFLVILEDGTGVKHERFSAVRVDAQLNTSQDAVAWIDHRLCTALPNSPLLQVASCAFP